MSDTLSKTTEKYYLRTKTCLKGIQVVHLRSTQFRFIGHSARRHGNRAFRPRFRGLRKTGTAQRADKMNSDAWCASYNNDYTVVVWHGSDSGMDEKGGGFATRQCQKTWRYIENKQPIAKKLTTSEFSIVLDVDLYATKQNKSVTIASESTPLEYRKSEIFSIDNQYQMSSCFDSVDFNESDVDIAKTEKKLRLR